LPAIPRPRPQSPCVQIKVCRWRSSDPSRCGRTWWVGWCRFSTV